MSPPSLTLTETPSGLAFSPSPSSPPIPLAPGSEARVLRNALLALRACGGDPPSSLIAHWTDHQSRPEGPCHWCKLEGRILAGQGRRRVSEGARPAPAGPSATFPSGRLRRALGAGRPPPPHGGRGQASTPPAIQRKEK